MTTANLKTFSSPHKEMLFPSTVIPHFCLPSSWQTLIYVLSLSICLRPAFHTDGVIHPGVSVSGFSPLASSFRGSSMQQHVSVFQSCPGLSSTPLYGWDYVLFICLSLNGYLGGLSFSAMMNNAAGNICVHIFVRTYFSRSGIAGPHAQSRSNVFFIGSHSPTQTLLLV